MTIENSSTSAIHSSPREKKRVRVAKQPRTTKARQTAAASKENKKLDTRNRTKTTRKPTGPVSKQIADLVANNPVVIQALTSDQILPIVPSDQTHGGSVEQGTSQSEVTISSVTVQDCSTTDALLVQEPAAEVEQQGPLSCDVQTTGRSHSLIASWRAFASAITKARTWTQDRLKSQQAKKRLRVCETVSLGEKRFVAVIQVDGERFLVGGSSSSVSTLAHLDRSPQFADVLRQQAQKDFSQA
ncbi:MAG: flagellar biosynthetic protein FliO [Acidobacteriia bacterium]|nr:flagellar biosynthetic protein FliO [Terriglobia bacterium]